MVSHHRHECLLIFFYRIQYLCIPFLLHLHVEGCHIAFDKFFLRPTIPVHVALFPAIVAYAFKSLPLRVIVIVLLSSPWLYSSLVTSSFVTIVSTFGRRPIIAPSFTCVECFFFTFNVMPPICLVMASRLANKFSNSTSDG